MCMRRALANDHPYTVRSAAAVLTHPGEHDLGPRLAQGGAAATENRHALPLPDELVDLVRRCLGAVIGVVTPTDAGQ